MTEPRSDGPRPVPSLEQLAAYMPPKHPAPIDLNLAGNEGAHPPASLLTALATDDLRRYPSAAALERELADRLGVGPGQVFVAAGGDEAIDRVCRAFLAPDRAIVLPAPTFVMLPHYSALAGARVIEVPWPGGGYPVDAVLDAIGPETAVVTVVSPNNPTGAVASADVLRRLSAAAPHAVLLVDLAYVEFADPEHDLTEVALSLPNAIAIRTLSKAWGLAGLRVGYAVGPAHLLEWLRRAGGPYSVAAPSLALAGRALDEGRAAECDYVARARVERDRLAAAARAVGADALPSQANFVLLRGLNAIWLRDALAGLGIGVRVFPEVPALDGCARVACPGDGAALERVERALRAALAPRFVWDTRPDPVTSPVHPHVAVRPLAERDPGHPAWRIVASDEALVEARTAGDVPLVLAPAADENRWLTAGAARVLPDLDALTALLTEVLP